MVTIPPEFDKVRRARRRRGWVASLMLFVVATLTALLWFRAVPAAVTSVASLAGGHAVVATVTACESDTGPCTVTLPDAPEQPRAFDEPGLFAPSQGSSVTVVEKDGRIVLAGLPAVAEAALLILLALCFTGFTLSWWRRVLESAPIMPDELDDLDRSHPYDNRRV